MALPGYRRVYVWNRDQVHKLISSRYSKHYVGRLLVWFTKVEEAGGDGESIISRPRETFRLFYAHSINYGHV